MKDEFFVVIYTVGNNRESVESVYSPFFLFYGEKCMCQFFHVRDDIDKFDMTGSPQHFERHSAFRRLKQRFQNDHTTSNRQTFPVHHSNARASQLNALSWNETD